MKIIFEGLDNTGKGTQIKNIRKAFKDKGFIISHSNFIKGFSNTEYKQMAEKEYSNMFKILNTDVDIICDRLHGGEMVYGQIYRNYNGDYVLDLELDYYLDEIDDLFLFVFIDNPQNLISRDDGLSFSTNLDDKKEEIALFERFYSRSIIKNKKLININNKSINKVKEEILSFIKERNG